MKSKELSTIEILDDLQASKSNVLELDKKIDKYKKQLNDLKKIEEDKGLRKHTKKVAISEKKFKIKQKKLIEKYSQKLADINKKNKIVRKKMLEKITSESNDDVMKFVRLQAKLQKLSLDYEYKENEIKRDIETLISLEDESQYLK